MSRSLDRITDSTHPPCPYCGGAWSESMKRTWHKGHPQDCRRKAHYARRDEEEARALRGGPMLVCGCAVGKGHDISTCSRYYLYHPEAEDGLEYRTSDNETTVEGI